ncbi:MAG TPA: polyamine aminopropyltransferase [Pseudolabrys sp.]|nr:polyamine aminopropyltransferase [Pseudolabrys sp.]
MAENRWIAETLFDEFGFRVSYEADRVLHESRTEHQHLVLFENKFFGKVLMLDGATQITSRDEYVYQEMMSHVPLFAHGHARDVLIIGGGDCGIAEEALKHSSIQRLTLVEIDASVVEFAKQHFPEFTGPVFADARFECVIDDGMRYVAQTERRFDAIIVDSTDPQGPAAVLFTREFYAACKRCLNPGGVLVSQNGVPFLQARELVTSITHFRALFADGACYTAAVPTYVGGLMAMGFASDDESLRRASVETITGRYRAAGEFPTQYWTPELHVGSFALPRFIADLVAAAKLHRNSPSP